MEDTKTKELRDYKFFCFDGVVRAMFVATERQNREEPYFDFFDENYKRLELKHGHENAAQLPEKPLSFNKMKELSEKLSKGFVHLRIDFYEIDGRPYLGELTFYHHNGSVPFVPDKWDYIFGSWLKLPTDK